MTTSPHDLLERLAVPRLPGSEALKDIEAFLAATLQDLGFQVTATRFVAHSPLDAVAVLGAGLGWLALLAIPLLIFPLPTWSAALFLGVGLSVLGVLGWGLARNVIPNPRIRAEVRNLEGRRGEPRIWLVAHSDSKGQGLSLAGRVVAVVGAVVGIGLLVLMATARLAGPVPWGWAVFGSVPLVVSGALLSRSRSRNDSPGAVDNATGVIAVLTAAEQLRARNDVGVLITSAEEYAMAGARVWVAETARREPFVNVEGIDARGAIRVMVHATRGEQGQVSRELASQLERVLTAGTVPVRVASLPPGILVDGTALARAGMPGVTVCRGDWSTLGIVHTVRDTAARVDPEAAAAVGDAIAEAVELRLG
jgi:hypothetical protein